MVNKTTKEQKLRLNREIIVYDMLNGGAYVNGIRFTNRKRAEWVFKVLGNWNSQYNLKVDNSILGELIYDADMTYNLQKAFELKGVIGHHQLVANSIIRALSRIGNVTGEDDIDIINKMIDVLSEYRMNRIKYGDEGVDGFDVLIRHYVIKSVKPVKQYLEKLKIQIQIPTWEKQEMY